MGYTAEVAGIINYLIGSGLPFKVTDVDTPGVHSPTSYHYRGLAVDFAGPQPSFNSPELLAIFNAFKPVEHLLAELIFSGGGYSIKDGRRVNRYAIDTHWNHVHVAVPKGTILKENPDMAVPADKELLTAFPLGSGYVIIAKDGAVYCFGCTYQGGIRWDDAKQAWVLR